MYQYKRKQFQGNTAVLMFLLLLVSLLIPSSLLAATLPAPTLSTAVQAGPQVKLAWVQPKATISGFEIQRSLDPVSGYATILTVGKSTLSANDTKVQAGNGYYYRVRAYKTFIVKSYSPWSNVAFADIPPAVTVDALPTVSVSAPTSVTSAQTVTITANATDDKGIAYVEIFAGTTLMKSDGTLPYSFDYNFTAADNGGYSITAKAYDTAGQVKTSAPVNINVNIPTATVDALPTVSVSAPTSVASAQTVTITANATDDKGIDYIEIFDGTTLRKADNTLPYSFNWSVTAADNGNHSVTAKAYDTAGQVKTSAAVNINVNIPTATVDALPTVSVSAPTSVTSAQTVTITANATDDKGIDYVEIFAGTTLLKADGTLPYSFAYNFTAADNGSYSITAKAYDTAGQVKTSAAVNINVNIPTAATVDALPTVSVSAPTSVTSAQTVTITANATDDKGIDYIEIFDGTTLLKADNTLPYSFNWSVTAANNGNHSITSKAYDTAGQVKTSAAVNINVNIAGAIVPPPTTSRPALSLRINPSFTASALPSQALTWYNRLWAQINNPVQMPMHIDGMASSNDTYKYGRDVNTHVTSLLQVLRVTGDPRILAEVDRIAELMRAQLKDWSITTYNGTTYVSDGYLNWQYFYDAGYHGTDAHQMDEQLSHSLVAAMAYAFHVNRDLDPRYAERADFWTNYLKNHFEAKWRKRTGIATGFPFLTKKLSHVHMQWTRYHYYMAKLTGDQAYYNEAVRMAGIMDQHVTEVSTPYGQANRWYHGMPILGETDLGVQRMSYARYTVHAAADMALEGFNVFGSPGFMEKMSVMLSYFVMDSRAPTSFAYLIDGTSDPRETNGRYSYSPYTQLGFWDTTGRVLPISQQVYNTLETAPEKPQRIFIPAGMLFSLLK